MKNANRLLTGLVVGVALCATSAMAQTYDLVILNGRVIDPESKLDAVRNVGIQDGRIEVVTEAKITGTQAIDAAGLIVAPGFIDLHSHGQDPYGIKLGLSDGVTTPLELEMGAYPIEDFYSQREGRSQANYGALVSHLAARIAVLDKINPKGSSR